MNRMHSDNDNDGDSGSSGGGKSEENKFQTKLNLRVWTFALHIHTSKKKKVVKLMRFQTTTSILVVCLFPNLFTNLWILVRMDGCFFSSNKSTKSFAAVDWNGRKCERVKTSTFFLLLLCFWCNTKSKQEITFRSCFFWWLTYFRWCSY